MKALRALPALIASVPWWAMAPFLAALAVVVLSVLLMVYRAWANDTRGGDHRPEVAPIRDQRWVAAVTTEDPLVDTPTSSYAQLEAKR